MNAEKIPHYVEPSTIKSKCAKEIARISDFVWWLMNHKNFVVDIGFVFTDSGICSSCVLKMRHDNSFKTHDEIVSECQSTIESIIKRHGQLRTVYVYGGNGVDSLNRPCYKVDF